MTLTPDQTIATDAAAAYKLENYPTLSDDDAFERFAMSQVALRRQNLDPSAIETGLVGAQNDGGIDGFYIFLNGQELIDSDSARLTRRRDALSGLQFGLTIDVAIVQAKNGTNWDSNVFPKIGSALKAILDNDASAASLRAFPLNDEEVVEKALMLKRLRAQLSMLAPLMNVTVEYVTFASQANVEAYLETKRVQLGDWLRTKLPSGSADRIEYVGDAKLVTRIRESNEFTAKLIFSKAPVRLGRALVGLVKLDDYLRFLRKDGSTVMRDELFAVNVRDYAGAGISVNNAIAETLAADTQSEFWWLNNGITLIADEARDPIELEWIITNPLNRERAPDIQRYSSSGRRR